jgi:hypothetical protein
MTTRQARKIVKNHMVHCRSRIDGPEDVTTAGRTQYPEGTYRKALRIVLRSLDRRIA